MPDSSVDTTFLNNGTHRANGPIQTILVQTDGRLLVGGPFSKINNLNRNGLARLMSDGTLDSSFNFRRRWRQHHLRASRNVPARPPALVGGSFLNHKRLLPPGPGPP